MSFLWKGENLKGMKIREICEIDENREDLSKKMERRIVEIKK